MTIKVIKMWVIVYPTGAKRYVTYAEARAYLKAHSDYTFHWLGSVCMLVVKSKGVKS